MLPEIIQVLAPTIPSIAEVSPDEKLFDRGLLDSFGLLEVIQNLETHFGITLGAEDLRAANFESLNQIAATVQRLRGNA